MSGGHLFAWLADENNLSWLATIVTIVGLPLGLIGLIAVAIQMRNDRLAVSAGAVADMRANMMQRIDRLASPHAEGDPGEAWEFECSELLNEIELACAIYLDGQMKGRTGRLAEHFLADIIGKTIRNSDIKAHMMDATHSADTFRNIREFTRAAGKEILLTDTGKTNGADFQPSHEAGLGFISGRIGQADVRL